MNRKSSGRSASGKSASRGSVPRSNRRLPQANKKAAGQKSTKNAATSKKRAAEPVAAPVQLPTLRLGFVRGVAPSKWAARWARAVPEQPLEIVPVDLREVAAARDDFDVLLERVMPGALPAGNDPELRTRHAMRLYEEAIALVVEADHELASRDSIDLAELELVSLLDHPDHCADWPNPVAWKDPAWMPNDAKATLELVATGLGGALMAQPLARHLSDKKRHAVIPVVTGEASSALPGTEIWASWRVERDAPDVQHLVGVLRGRTARSSR